MTLATKIKQTELGKLVKDIKCNTFFQFGYATVYFGNVFKQSTVQSTVLVKIDYLIDLQQLGRNSVLKLEQDLKAEVARKQRRVLSESTDWNAEIDKSKY